MTNNRKLLFYVDILLCGKKTNDQLYEANKRKVPGPWSAYNPQIYSSRRSDINIFMFAN